MKGMVITLHPRTLECSQYIHICLQVELKSIFAFIRRCAHSTCSFFWDHIYEILCKIPILTFDYRSWSNNEPLIFPNILTFETQFLQSHLPTFYVLVDMTILQPIRVACDCVLTELWRSRKLG